MNDQLNGIFDYIMERIKDGPKAYQAKLDAFVKAAEGQMYYGEHTKEDEPEC